MTFTTCWRRWKRCLSSCFPTKRSGTKFRRSFASDFVVCTWILGLSYSRDSNHFLKKWHFILTSSQKGRKRQALCLSRVRKRMTSRFSFQTLQQKGGKCRRSIQSNLLRSAFHNWRWQESKLKVRQKLACKHCSRSSSLNCCENFPAFILGWNFPWSLVSRWKQRSNAKRNPMAGLIGLLESVPFWVDFETFQKVLAYWRLNSRFFMLIFIIYSSNLLSIHLFMIK